MPSSENKFEQRIGDLSISKSEISRFYMDGEVLHSVEFLRKRHWTLRVDLWLVAIIYNVWLISIGPCLDALIVLCSLVALRVLISRFGLDKCFKYSKVDDIHHADACKVILDKFSGSIGVVPLQMLAGSSNSIDGEEIYFDFMKQRFVYSKEKNTFCKLCYPTKETMGYYLKTSGYGTKAEVVAATEKWGRNVIEYPLPTLTELMKKQCMQPTFVHQIFAALAWSIYGYWYCSLFVLFTLFMFESTVAKECLMIKSALASTRGVSQSRFLMVYRCGKWVKLSGTELLPGDIASVVSFVPADMLILAGSTIVNEAIVTGDSTPQWKVSVMGRGSEEKLSFRRDKAHVLFTGTKILEHTPDMSFHIKTPDGGCLAVVLQTGFETNQGKLMHAILFSTKSVTFNRQENKPFILFLVQLALIAFGFVLEKGLEDPKKLILSYLLIIACVTPPELAIQMLITINMLWTKLKRQGAFKTSYIALECGGIICTEPFRVAIAGKVDVCCFDKTGTLTSDEMDFSGIGGLMDSEVLETGVLEMPTRTLEILASCHALAFVDNKLVGDPLEKAALKGIGWDYKSDEMSMSNGGGNAVLILQRYHFSSHLKRMAVVVCVKKQFFAFVKGAPETIQERLVHMPAFYVQTYKKYAHQGFRVLALAYKSLPVMTEMEARSLDRDVVESGLTFAGFAVFSCPIRSDSAAALSKLKELSLDLVMITGDQALTACYVAGQVNIVSKPALILGTAKNSEGYEWVSPDENNIVKYRENAVEALSESYDLCIGGDCIEMLQQTSGILKVIPHVKVFARMTPEQKELIVTTFKLVGRVTLMCGDGINDVGALKQAHIGVGVPSAKPLPANSQAVSMWASNPDMMAVITTELGYASVTSSFVAKRTSVASIIDIIRQGRSNLVINLQTLKIIFLQTAYLSVMYLYGMKETSIQATIHVVSATAFFQFMQHARPVGTLSAERPHFNKLCTYVFLSVLGQFGVHFLVLLSCVKEAENYMPDEFIEQEDSLTSTLTFMACMMILVATCTANYMGHPFNQSISENKLFLYTLVTAVGLFEVITFELFRDLNDWLKLVPLPIALRDKLAMWAFLMFLCCNLWERLLRWWAF